MTGQPDQPGVRKLSELGHAELAVLAREYLLAGQLMDRAGMPHVIAEFGREVMGQIAIDEWMGASPIYTRRIQELLGFASGDVETIFKGMQFDIGAPPEFMDFRYKVIDSHHGEFWLEHCGALMDVEPMGDTYVTTMCHDIEDPTFDATATATNPRARMTPLHRPPREPSDRSPHCHWEVIIDDEADPLPDPPQMLPLLDTLLVGLPAPSIDGSAAGETDENAAWADATGTETEVIEPGDERWTDYTVPLDPDLRFEQFSKSTLLALLEEFALQSHLLVMSLLAAVERRSSTEMAIQIGLKQFIGSAGLTAERLRLALNLGNDLDSITQLIEVHPAFLPRSYVDLRIEQKLGEAGVDELHLSLLPCPATAETAVDSWMTILADGHDDAMRAVVQGVNPRAALDSAPVAPGAIRTWRITIGALAADEMAEVGLTRFSSGSDFEFAPPGPVSATRVEFRRR